MLLLLQALLGLHVAFSVASQRASHVSLSWSVIGLPGLTQMNKSIEPQNLVSLSGGSEGIHLKTDTVEVVSEE